MEKMQEMFIKDLEELKNKESEMHNTLEGINSRITEAEEQITDLEDRMVEISVAGQNIGKRMEGKKKQNKKQPKRPLEQHYTHQHLHYMGSQKEKKHRKNLKKYLKR